MKNITTKILVLGLTATLLTCGITACKVNKDINVNVNVNGEEVISTHIGTGSWEIAESNAMTNDLQKIFDEAISKIDGYNYKPVALLGTQIVSGTNYAFLCESTIISEHALRSMMITYINVNPQGSADFVYDERVILPGTDVENGDNLAGGWAYAESSEITADIKTMFENLATKDVDDTYEPVAYVGSQVVAGTNHAVLCKVISNTVADKTSLAIVYVYEDLNGKCQITNTETIELRIG